MALQQAMALAFSSLNASKVVADGNAISATLTKVGASYSKMQSSIGMGRAVAGMAGMQAAKLGGVGSFVRTFGTFTAALALNNVIQKGTERAAIAGNRMIRTSTVVIRRGLRNFSGGLATVAKKLVTGVGAFIGSALGPVGTIVGGLVAYAAVEFIATYAEKLWNYVTKEMFSNRHYDPEAIKTPMQYNLAVVNLKRRMEYLDDPVYMPPAKETDSYNRGWVSELLGKALLQADIAALKTEMEELKAKEAAASRRLDQLNSRMVRP